MKWASDLLPALVCAAVCTGCLTSDKPLIDDASADHPFQPRTLIEVYSWDDSAKVFSPSSRQLIERSAGGYVLLPASTPEVARLKKYAENLYVAETARGIGVLEAGSDGLYRVYEDLGEGDCVVLGQDEEDSDDDLVPSKPGDSTANSGNRLRRWPHEGHCTVPDFQSLVTVLEYQRLAEHFPTKVFRVVQATDDAGTTFDLCLPREVVEQRVLQIAGEDLQLRRVPLSELSPGKSLRDLGMDDVNLFGIMTDLETWFGIALPLEPAQGKKSTKHKRAPDNGDVWTVETLTDRVRKATGCTP